MADRSNKLSFQASNRQRGLVVMNSADSIAVPGGPFRNPNHNNNNNHNEH